MTVKIYKEYNFDDFKEFIEEYADNDAVEFIEENNLWEAVFNDYNNSARYNNIYYEEDRIIDEINDLNYLRELLDEEI